MREFEIRWTHCNGYEETGGFSTIRADSEADAEAKFWKCRKEMNPYKGNFTGFVIESVVDVTAIHTVL